MSNHALAVTPSDTLDLGQITQYLSFANTGAQTLHITTVAGEDVSILLPAGMWPIRARRVWSTGTSVTSIVAYWT
jgi:hypothetical protein